jgi:TonB family protein
MLDKTNSSLRDTWKSLLIVPILTITASLIFASNPPKVNGEKYIQTTKGNTDSLYKKRFPGGAKAYTKFLSKNIRYPRAAQMAFATGAVTAQFQLSPDGSVKNIKVIIAAREDMGEEIVRLLNLLPKFDAAPSGKTKTETILFTVVFSMQDDNGKPVEPDLSKMKADVHILGFSPRYKQQ